MLYFQFICGINLPNPRNLAVESGNTAVQSGLLRRQVASRPVQTRPDSVAPGSRLKASPAQKRIQGAGKVHFDLVNCANVDKTPATARTAVGSWPDKGSDGPYNSLMPLLVGFSTTLKANMSRRWNRIAAGLLFVFIASFAARAQGGAAGIAPAVLAKANAGDAASQLLVGLEYQKGDVVPRDFVQAMAWYRKAADQGNAQAQCSLGMLLAQPNSGVIEDDAQAAAWLRKAADQGFAEAEYQLGQSLSRGKGVPQDDAQAAAWFQKAVAQKNADAMVALALLYAGGKGVAKDEKQASA